MFFTIVIPAYNCQNTINRLLNSIKDQDMNDFKVIVCDDSDEQHQGLYELIQPYEQFFAIDYYQREEEPYTIHCPGNTRHSGLNRALMEDTCYIIFIDCDDQFIPNTFQTIKNSLINVDLPDVVGSNFDVYDDDVFAYQDKDNLGWLHGKLFKKDFIIRQNVQFKIDMATHEDTYFNCLVSYCQNLEHTEPAHFDDFVFYIWYRRPDSTSHKDYNESKDGMYIQDHFADYCSSCIGVFLENYKPNLMDAKIYRDLQLRISSSVYMAYCYFQGFYNSDDREKLGECHKIIRDYVWLCHRILGITPEDIINVAYSNQEMFTKHRESSYIGVGYYLEHESFQDFIRGIKFYE